MITFFVPGDVVPWARAGGGKTVVRFTPAKQANYMGALKLYCQNAMRGAKPLEGPIALDIVATWPWPKSMSARKRQAAGAEWRTSRPDADNIAKIVGDALNRVAWMDDAQIVSSSIEKRHGDTPGLFVKIGAL